jgi:hypothetical protein
MTDSSGAAFVARGTAGDRGAVSIRLSEAEAAALFDDVPAASLRQSGMHHVAVTGEVDLAASRGLAVLRFVRFLRDATCAGVWVSWSGKVGKDLDTELLCHLPPPLPQSHCSGPGPSAPEQAWRACHETGLCYYRAGPGFVQVTDRRPGALSRRKVLNARPQLQVFTSYLVPGPVPVPGDTRAATCAGLIGDRLLMRIGDHAVTLPHRLGCRPVPWDIL